MRSNLRAEVSATIRAEMARRDLTQRALAEHLGLPGPSVGRRMRGDVSWRLDELESLAELFGLSIHDLIPVATPSPTT